jgi:hypothetical protein
LCLARKRGLLEAVNRKKTIRPGTLSVRSADYSIVALTDLAIGALLTQLLAHALVDAALDRENGRLHLPISGRSCALL